MTDPSKSLKSALWDAANILIDIFFLHAGHWIISDTDFPLIIYFDLRLNRDFTFKYRRYDVQIEVLPAARAKLKLLGPKGEKISLKIISDFLEKLNRRVSCRFWEQSFFALSPRDRSLIKIVDINGFTKVSELLNSAKAQK